MNDGPADELVDLGDEHWIALSYTRRWPKYVVNWSIRRRAGDSDFPLANGELEALPSTGPSTEEIWSRLRQLAVEEATARQQIIPARGKRSLLARILGRG